jgi:hypothetical protein
MLAGESTDVQRHGRQDRETRRKGEAVKERVFYAVAKRKAWHVMNNAYDMIGLERLHIAFA